MPANPLSSPANRDGKGCPCPPGMAENRDAKLFSSSPFRVKLLKEGQDETAQNRVSTAQD